jgi:hypothetical protein
MRSSNPLVRYGLVALISSAAGSALTGAFAQPGGPSSGQLEPLDLAAEDALMSRFIGTWEGEGEAQGKSVTKEQRCEWALGKRFISIRSRSRSGDNFQSEAYLRFNPAERRYELYEFNNGDFPVTAWIGRRDRDRLVLEGKLAGRTVRATYMWLDKNRMQVLLSDDKGEMLKTYAGGVFRRQRTRGEERDL